MKSLAGTLAAPFPYFGGKALACETVWKAFGAVDNYVEPFAGSAAMLLGAPDGKRVETINDADGYVANFWRAVAHDAEAVACYADWPTNEADLFARHSWLVRQRADLLDRLHADPEWSDAKIAGWWCWGACNWIGSGWCSGTGPWVHDGETLVDMRKLPHLGDAGRGINRQLPHLGDAGQGINRKLPHLGNAGQGDDALPRAVYIHEWFSALQARMRDVRVTCGDWSRVVKDSVTTRHGLTGLFLDPPYTKGEMDYSAGGVGGELATQVREWCAKNGNDKALRIVLCGHAGEHDALLAHGWQTRQWTARKGYAVTDEAVENSASETLWCSPHCVPEVPAIADLFASEAA
jgi:DNA adenine methylase